MLARNSSRSAKRKNTLGRKIGLRLIAVGLILIGCAYLLDLHIRPIITKVSLYQCQVIATKIINQAIFDQLEGEGYDYSSLVTFTTNANGDVIALESNMQSINRFKAELTLLVNDAITQIDEQHVDIALGTVTGAHLLYGKGPVYRFRLSPGGYVNTRLISSFTSAGINQTLHQIVLEVTVNVAAIIPGYTQHVDVVSDYIMAETVIVGSIPESYTHVITESTDMLSQLNDYNAENHYD